MILGGKALVLVSHYPFFNLYRLFLSQLYRVSLSDPPLPIERYVANFCSEVPLPPRGQVEVEVAASAACNRQWQVKIPFPWVKAPARGENFRR